MMYGKSFWKKIIYKVTYVHPWNCTKPVDRMINLNANSVVYSGHILAAKSAKVAYSGHIDAHKLDVSLQYFRTLF